MTRTIRPLSRRLIALHRQSHSTPSVGDSASHSELLSNLKEIDSIALATTRRQIAALSSISSTLSTLTSTVASSASTIQLNPSIPAYKPRFWSSHATTLPPKYTALAARIHRLDQNLSDLQATPYKEETGETETQKFKTQIAQGSDADKWTEYQNLKFEEDAVAHRLQTAVDGLEALIDSWREENLARRRSSSSSSSGDEERGGGGGGVMRKAVHGSYITRTFKPTFRKAVAGSVVEAEDEKSKKKKKKKKTASQKQAPEGGGKKNKAGRGQGATEVAEVAESKTASSFGIKMYGAGSGEQPTFSKRPLSGSRTRRKLSVSKPGRISSDTAPTEKQEARGQEHEKEKEVQAPAATSKAKDLFALQAEMERSMRS